MDDPPGRDAPLGRLSAPSTSRVLTQWHSTGKKVEGHIGGRHATQPHQGCGYMRREGGRAVSTMRKALGAAGLEAPRAADVPPSPARTDPG